MKKTTKVILSSTMTIAMCASLIAGSTLALFSSRTNVDVALKASKVDVSAYVEEDSLKGYSTKWDDTTFDYVQYPTSELEKDGVALPANTFYAGGTYSYAEGVLSLDNISPGDAVEFNLKIENRSTIAIQYRVQLTVPTTVDGKEPQGDIVKELQVSFNGEDPVTIGDESTFAQPWSTVIDKGVEITETPKIRIELPREVEGEGFEDQSCLLHVGVYAVQLGTHVADAEGTYNAYTTADFLAISSLLASRHTFEGETIELGADIDLSTDSDGGASTLSIALADTPATIAETSESQRAWIFGGDDSLNGLSHPFKGTLNGNGYTISGFKVRRKSDASAYNSESGDYKGYGLFRYTDGATIENLVIENVTLEIKTDYQNKANMPNCGYVGIVAGQAKDTTFKNITVRNSSATSVTNYDQKTKMFSGNGNRLTRTLEEAERGEHTNMAIVGYDFVGALAGQIIGTTKVESVNINLNEASTELTGMKIFGNTPDFGPDQSKHTKEYTVAFTGTSTVVCTSAEGLVETLKFTSENNGSETTATTPSATAEIGSVDALTALAQSVTGGRDFENVTITLTDDIDLTDTDSDLTIGEGTFSGMIEGNDKTISGLDLENAGLLSGATVQNANLEFTTKTTNVTVADPDSELESIAANYKNTTVTVANGDASYTVTYGEEGMTAAAFNGNEFTDAQTLTTGISYSFDGVTFASLSGTEETTATATITNSTFGAAPAGIMLAAEGPAVLNVTFAAGSVLSENTFNGDVTIGGMATFKGNTMSGTLTLGGSVTLEGNTLASVAMGEGAKVLFAAGNTIDGKTVTYDETWTGYTYVGWDVTFDEEGKITSGTFVLGAAFSKEDLAKLATEHADIVYFNNTVGLAQNSEGKYVLASAKDILALDNYTRNAKEVSKIDAILTNNIDIRGVTFDEVWAEATMVTCTIEGQDKVIIFDDYSSQLQYSFFFHLGADSIIKNVNFLAKKSWDMAITYPTVTTGAIFDDVFFAYYKGQGSSIVPVCDYSYVYAYGNRKSTKNDADCIKQLIANKEATDYQGTSSSNKTEFNAYLNGIFGAYLN